MSMILDGTSGLTTPGVVNTAGETIATTLSVTSASTLTGGITVPTTSLGNVCGGTYTPTLTDGGNTSVRTARLTNWFRVGNVVTVSGVASITTTATGATDLRISLPVASTLTTYQLNGMTQAAGYNTVGFVTSATTVARALYNSPATSSVDIIFEFTYLVV